jgi:hypothetical protein
VGQLVPAKGVPGLLQALSRLGQRRRDWHLDIVGRSREDGVRTSRCRLEPLRRGRLPRAQDQARAEFMRGADFLVMASLCETFSAPLAEAMATGIPVLATVAGGQKSSSARGRRAGATRATSRHSAMDWTTCSTISIATRPNAFPSTPGSASRRNASERPSYAVYRAILRGPRRSRRIHDSTAQGARRPSPSQATLENCLKVLRPGGVLSSAGV